MNIERMNNMITEKNGFQNISYILEEDKMFLISHYKILNGKDKEGLLKCVKVTSNGKVKLVYFTKEMKPFTAMISYMNFSAFVSVLEKILSAVINVKRNGFLQMDNLNLAFKKIFIDPDNLDVGLVYIPIVNEAPDQSEAERQFKEEVYEYFETLTIYFSPLFDRIRELFNDKTKSLEDIAAEIRNINSYSAEGPAVNMQETVSDGTKQFENVRIRLVALGSAAGEIFVVNGSDFIIGKNRENCDGVIQNSMVSRRHCLLTYQAGKHFIEDLDSTNGTKINNERIPSRQKREIKVGDIISFANANFRVEV